MNNKNTANNTNNQNKSNRNRRRRRDNNNPPNNSNNNNKNSKYRSRENQQRGQQQTWTNRAAQANKSMEKLEELLAKSPEDIILSFKDPRFQIVDFLNAPIMNDETVHKLTEVFTKAFECNSIQIIIRQRIEQIIDSLYFRQHLYEVIPRWSPQQQHPQFYTYGNTNQNRRDLIELAINLCCRFLLLQPSSQPQLSRMKDRIQLVVVKKSNNKNIQTLFNMFDNAYKEASNRYININIELNS